MKKLLVLFVNEFPYNFKEPFLESEYPLYREYFDKVLIVTNRPVGLGARSKKTREVNDDAIEILDVPFTGGWKTKLAFAGEMLADSHAYSEILRVLFRHKANMHALHKLYTCLGKANRCVKAARKRVKELEAQGYETVGAYAYWMIYPAYAAVKFNRKYYGGKLYTVSRAHRVDLYEDRSPGNYIPCRKYILTGLSEIASISDDGRDYLQRVHPDFNMNITIHHLGARDVGTVKRVEKSTDGTFRIVSCSRAVPVKRIGRIIDALSHITEFDVEWTHCGGGELLEELKQKAATLPPNVRCIFTDLIPNTEVYERYANNDYHVFLNVSQSEGVPVSIMEAMSFGIPVIATAVGGTPELIEVGKSGYLLDEEYDDATLVEYLRSIQGLSQEEYDAMRAASRDKFERDYNAIPNYHKFLQSLLKNATEK